MQRPCFCRFQSPRQVVSSLTQSDHGPGGRHAVATTSACQGPVTTPSCASTLPATPGGGHRPISQMQEVRLGGPAAVGRSRGTPGTRQRPPPGTVMVACVGQLGVSVRVILGEISV